MERESARSRRVPAFLAITAVALLTAATARAAEEPGDTGIVADSEAAIETSATATQTQTVMVEAVEPKFRLDIYGFAMIDTGYDFKQVNPDWFDVLRPTKLPAFDNEFGEDGNYYAGVRQSRLGVKGYIPTALGELKTIFEFEMFGTGGDAGQTTIRLRHAWGELGAFGAGQSWSPFMDPDVFPRAAGCLRGSGTLRGPQRALGHHRALPGAGYLGALPPYR